MAVQLHIDLLGTFRLTCGGDTVATVNTTRMQLLLAYLVLHRGAPQPRQHLAFSFWPDSTETQAHSNLRTLLYHLRQALPDADRFLDVDAQTLTWKATAPFVLDVAAFEEASARAEDAIQRADTGSAREALEQAAALYRGDLLAGLYDEWILPERERLHQQCTRVLERLVHLLEDGRSYPDAIRWAERLLQHDPLREPTYRLLMRLYALNGDRAGAVRAYRTCETVLRRELDLDPEPSTHALHERLMSDGAPPREERDPQPVASSRAPAAELPLVGRRRAWERLRARWCEAAEGRAQLVTICGVAGIGKTRLAEEVLTWVARQGFATAQARAYAAEGRLAYAPIAAWLRSEAIRPALARLDAVWLAEVARLVPELHVDHPELREPGPLREGWQRQRLFEALARALLAGGRPLLLFIDDLQWCDRESLEWLRFLLRFAPEARLLVVGTVRTEEVDADHPLRRLLLDLGRTGRASEVVLEPLDEADTTRLAAHVAGRALSDEQAALLYDDTEGHPLFVVESVRAGVPSSDAAAEATRPYGLPPALMPRMPSLPPTVQRVIATRLTQLSPSARAVAGVAATVGQAFPVEILHRAGHTDEEQMADALEELWQRRILREQAPDVYDFTHDKLREVAYAEIAPARRRLLHRRIAEALRARHAPDTDAVDARIAVHYERGGLYEEAISFYERAADVAHRVHADEEVARLLRRALVLLEQLPKNRARDERELRLRTALGPALSATRGWAHPDVGETYERAHALCQHLEIEEQRFSSLWGLWTFRLVRAELKALQELTALLLRTAEAQPLSRISRAARLAGFFNAFFLGELAEARAHLDEALALPESARSPAPVSLMSADERVFCHCCAAHLWWFLGYPDRALQHATEALRLADASKHPFNRTTARCYVAMLHQYRGEPRAVEEHTEVADRLCGEHGFFYYSAWCTLMQGWVQTERGALTDGIAQMQRGLAALRETGGVLREPYYSALLAEAYGRTGQLDRGTTLLAEALEVAARRGEHWIEAELYRLNGELLLVQDAEREAAANFRQAEDVAARQKNRSLMLRAAMSRSRLWHRQGNTAEARRHLHRAYTEFSEGNDTQDLKEAAALLAAWT